MFEILIIHKPFLGPREIPQKIGPDQFMTVLTFIGCKQTDRQAKFKYRDSYIFCQIIKYALKKVIQLQRTKLNC